ncbi:MAG: ABC transporter permease, partial [Parabacteroides sp.]
MYRIYFKQAWNLIRQEKLFSLIYILGTGLSVAMVMVLSIIFYVRIANVYPETNRSRTLVVKSAQMKAKIEGEGSSSSALSEKLI